MKFKILPEAPESLEELEAVHAAVPLVPDSEHSCCVRLIERTHVASQDRAKEWLTFLRALRMAEMTDGGYRRLGFDTEPLAEQFRERIYLADDVLAVLAGTAEPVDRMAVFGRLRDRVSHWERRRHADPDAVWTERIERILQWAVLFGLAERRDAGYVAARANLGDGAA